MVKRTVLYLAVFSTAAAGSLVGVEAAAREVPPQDHGGADLVLQDGDVIWGQHTGLRSFVVPSSTTVRVMPYRTTPGQLDGRLWVFAQEIHIAGTLDAVGAGYTGGGGGAGGPDGVPGRARYPDGESPFHGGEAYYVEGDRSAPLWFSGWAGGGGGDGDDPRSPTSLMGRGGDGGGGCFNGWIGSPGTYPQQLTGLGGRAGGCGGGGIHLQADTAIFASGHINASGALGGHPDGLNGGNAWPPPPEGAVWPPGDIGLFLCSCCVEPGEGGRITLQAPLIQVGGGAELRTLGGDNSTDLGGTLTLITDTLAQASDAALQARQIDRQALMHAEHWTLF